MIDVIAAGLLGSKKYRKKKNYTVNSGIDTSSLENTTFSELAKNNPYTNYQYTPGAWDAIGNFLGFRTGEDRYREQMQLAAAQYDNQLLSTAREENYNNELNTANRMRLAGLNPDLQGLGNGSEASEFTEPETNPEPAETDGAILQNFAGTMLNVITMSVGLFDQFEGIKAKKIANEAQELANYNSYVDFARKWVLDQMDMNPDNLHKAEEWKKGIVSNQEWLYNLPEFQATMYGMNNRQKKHFKAAVNQVITSVPTTIEGYKKWKELEENRKGYAKLRGSGYYKESDTDMYETIGVVVKELEKLDRKQIKAQTKKAEGDITYYDNLDPALTAEAVNAQNKETAAAETAENEVNSAYRSIIDQLNKRAENGSKWAEVMLFAVMIIKNMSVQSRSEAKTDARGNTTENSGFSLGF